LPLSNSQLKELARHGATARIQELESEIASIRATFPDMGGASRRGRRPGRKGASAGAQSAPRKRGHMSSAARKAASLRMKKYWAAKRAGKK
jgi:hypothetical protein